MNKAESAQIELIRIFCILSMMWVHVSPGMSVPSIVNGGSLDFVGRVLGGTLGRISVTTLSFVSGYLLWQTAANRSMRDVVRRLGASIFLPTMVWSGVFILLIHAKTTLLGLGSTVLDASDASDGGVMGALNAWVGLTGPTANLSLFFIRDLIVSTLVVRTFFPLLRRAPILVVAMVLPLAFFDTLDPILFRPTILIFVALGAVSNRAGLTIPRFAQPRTAVPLGFLFVISAHLIMTNFADVHLTNLAHNFIGRAGLGFFILTLSGAFLVGEGGRSYAYISRHCFLAYLSHVPVIGVFWVVWQRVVGGAQDPSYVIFYLMMPPIIMTLAVMCGRGLDHMPTGFQIVMRGKSVAHI